jgi:tetratricopeptide (TPR) repeat protein
LEVRVTTTELQNAFVADDRAMGKCPVLYAPLGPRLVGRDGDLASLADQLRRARLAVLKGASGGIGSTAVVAEFCERFSGDYPGGVYWVPYRVSNQKDVAADVIEALELPCPVSQRYPFIGVDGALQTMWRGLSGRPRTLLVMDGWTSLDTAKVWTSPDDAVHVLGIASQEEAVPGDVTVALGPPAPDAVREALGRFGAASLAARVGTSGLLLAMTLALVEDGHSPSDLEDAGSELGRAIASLSGEGRRLLGVLSLLNDQPVPTALLDAIYRRLSEAGRLVDWRTELAELSRLSLVAVTTFGEPRVHRTLLGPLGVQFSTQLDGLRTPVLEGVVEALRAVTRDFVHAARRLVPHTYAVLTGGFEGKVSTALFAELIDLVSSGTSEPLALIAARQGIESARSDGDHAGAVRYQLRLGHTFSQLRRLDEAQSTLRDALSGSRQVFGPDSLEVANVIDHLERAIGLGVCGDAGPEELELAERAHAIRERAWGEDDARLRGSLEHLALRFAVRDRHAEALELYERAVRLAAPWGAKDTHLLRLFALCLAENGRSEDAVATLDRIMDLEALKGFSTGVSALWSAEETLRKAKPADNRLLGYVERVLREKAWREDDEDQADRAKVLAVYARTLASAGRPEDARKVAAEAIPLLERYYGPHHRSLPGLKVLSVSST